MVSADSRRERRSPRAFRTDGDGHSLARARRGPRYRRDAAWPPGGVTPLLHAQRHEPQLAVAIGDEQQHGLLAVLFQLVDALLDIGGVGNGFLAHLEDDIAGGQALFGGIRVAVDAGDNDALDAVLDLVLGAQILA